VDHVDVLIIGAGLSGVGAGCHLETSRPGTTYTILEAREAIGGTWDLFRYPGIRSDSDMFTLGYRFRPWVGRKSLADGPSILRYVRETARDFGVDEHIRYNHRVVRAEWSTADSQWTVYAETAGETVVFTCGFLFCCGGYYRYDEGYTPRFTGIEDYEGQVVHPQHWPHDLDYAGKRVVVIGSGATAVTLVPAMAPEAGHVTMLQRSPTYILSVPEQDAIANGLRRVLGERPAYAVTRAKNVLLQSATYRLSRRRPGLVKAVLRRGAQSRLPEGYAVDTHFAPRYQPWDQRLCLVPEGDLFTAISQGTVSVVTGEIDTFTETGIRLASGDELAADIVITATGLNLLPLGGVRFSVDGREVDLPETMAYKGVMLSGVPNFAYVIGYTNASWTLKADLACEYLTRLLRHMDEHGYRKVVPERDPAVSEAPFIDLASGYVKRSLDQLPKQGDRAPWRLRMNYLRDLLTVRHGAIEDDALRFTTGSRTTTSV
jgi:monooxygenase